MVIRAIVVPLALAALGLGCVTDAGATSEDSAPPIVWRDWGPEVFAEAKASNKLLLVDVGIEGCTACRRMYEITYAHHEVRRRVHDKFIAVAVDADARPDVGQRYVAWGWPATIFIAPDGTQVHAVRGNKLPRNFLPILDELIGRAEQGTLAERAPVVVAEVADEGALGDRCRVATRRFDRKRNVDTGGWGSAPFKAVQGAPLEHAFMRARARGDKGRLDHALSTASSTYRLLDPEWGGVFVASRTPDWSSPIPEKRTVHQAAALLAASRAYGATRDPAWLERAGHIRRYLETMMRADDGTFFATQEDDAPKLPRELSAVDYYALPDDERRQYGVPPIDHGVYTDINARAIVAYAALFEASGDETALEIAVGVADALLSTRRADEGWLHQAAPVEGDARMREQAIKPRLYLRPQAYFGRALLALHHVTGERRWLDDAKKIATALTRLEDERGGFFASDDDGTATFVGRHKPVEDNAVAARFLLDLATFTHDEGYEKTATKALAWAGDAKVLADVGDRAAANVAIALERATAGPTQMSVTGGRDNPEAQALFAAARELYDPRKVLHWDDDEKYPYPGASVFVCSASSCSMPITDPKRLADIAEGYAEVDAQTACGDG